ncbi:hypothetical protein [Okeania hirsuta]|uniref:hypothetical protein n=1 Tax=Okeania hirsuta TaxID=1458930 RepID=UPI001F032CFD|nr:hypothetical protein [Okeania hirsuta]
MAESDDIVNIEGNAYFPVGASTRIFFQDSGTQPFVLGRVLLLIKLSVDGKETPMAAWFTSTKDAQK